MSEHRGICSTCHRPEVYVFASGLCMLCEDARLLARLEVTDAIEDAEALALFRDCVQDKCT